MRDAFKKTETEKPNSKNLLIKEKEILPEHQPINLEKTERPPAPDKRPTPEPAVRCSVIQRTPVPIDNELKIVLPRSIFVHCHPEPEQEQPIDYHVPKRREYDEEQEKRTREARRNSAIKGGRSLSAIYLARAGKLNGIVSAAAGHGRSNGSSQQSGTNQSNNQNCGGSINFNGAGSGGGGGGVNQGGNSGGVGGGGVGGTGAGGGMGGRDGRSNYGPNSPPTGSLPPFYESLKGGNNGMNAYNAANGQYMSQNGYNLINNMDCDTTQELTNLGGYSDSNQNNNSIKNYALLQNHSGYGISLKSEDDLEYDSKMDNLNMLQSSYSVYDVNESMMVDIGAAVVDPLQFTATLTFSSPAEHALMESLSDAVDLSSFLQRLPSDDHHSSSDNLDLSSTPSLTPDSVSITAIDSNGMEPFTDHMMLGRYDRNGYIPNKMYHESPPSYQTTRDMMMSHQQQHEHQMISSNGLGFNNLDIDQHSDLSLPSPGASCDGGLIDDKRNVQQNVSSTMVCDRPIKKEVLSQRVSILVFFFYKLN